MWDTCVGDFIHSLMSEQDVIYFAIDAGEKCVAYGSINKASIGLSNYLMLNKQKPIA